MKYRIMIPSRERARWLMTHKKCTLSQLTYLNTRPELWVRLDDSEHEAYVSLASRWGAELHFYEADDIYGYADTVDLLIDSACASDADYLIMLDDDVEFRMFNPASSGSLYVRCSDEQVSDWLGMITGLLSAELPVMSPCPIERRSQPHALSFCKPMSICYFMQLQHFRTHPEHRFYVGPELPAWSDFNLSVRMLKDGYLNAYTSTFLIAHVFNNPGGCLTYRKVTEQTAGVRYVARTHPDVAKVHRKVGWLKDQELVRESLQVQWLQALDHDKFRSRFDTNAARFAYGLWQKFELTYGAWFEAERVQLGRL